MKNPFFRSDDVYQQYEQLLRAKTKTAQWLTIFYYLLPGIVFTLLVNVSFVHDGLSAWMGLESRQYQFWLLIGLTFGWHIAYPVFMLRFKRRLGWREVARALSLNRFSNKGFFVLTPLFFVLLLVVAVPYMLLLFPAIHQWLQSIPLFAIPKHSIFASYETIYDFAPWQLLLLFVGNFLGEEVYFRGYLLKKSAFLGRHNWWIHSILFSVYHLWQIPMTYGLTFISLSFGLFMVWRKNLYELMLLHLLINLLLPVAVAYFS